MPRLKDTQGVRMISQKLTPPTNFRKKSEMACFLPLPYPGQQQVHSQNKKQKTLDNDEIECGGRLANRN